MGPAWSSGDTPRRQGCPRSFPSPARSFSRLAQAPRVTHEPRTCPRVRTGPTRSQAQPTRNQTQNRLYTRMEPLTRAQKPRAPTPDPDHFGSRYQPCFPQTPLGSARTVAHPPALLSGAGCANDRTPAARRPHKSRGPHAGAAACGHRHKDKGRRGQGRTGVGPRPHGGPERHEGGSEINHVSMAEWLRTRSAEGEGRGWIREGAFGPRDRTPLQCPHSPCPCAP